MLPGDIPLELVIIPGGNYLMGAPETEEESSESERPQHEVTISRFAMGKYPVTQAQWQVIMKNNPSYFKDDRRPVERVTWNDAIEFCDRLSRQTGMEYRLPSEAEWEYACRAGSTKKYFFGDEITPKQGNFYSSETSEVGKYLPNDFGLYDMHGNVLEWCQDYWHEDYQDAPEDGAAWVTGGDSTLRILRGGSWYAIPANCRSAYRLKSDLDERYVSDGLRVVFVLPKSP